MSKYAPLAEYLHRAADDQVDMSFAQIEQVIGEPLPKSARVHSAWWANEQASTQHVQAHAWISGGWNASVDLERETVRFHRKR